MPRITTLLLYFLDFPERRAPAGLLRGSQMSRWSQLLMQVLTEPAPRLVSFQLRHVEGSILDTYYNAAEPVQIYYPLFSGIAPCLRRCRLGSILFPQASLCNAAFRDVTTFSYTMPAEISLATIILILQAMPRLEVLELDAPDIDGRVEELNVAQCPLLRVLLLSILELRIEQLSPLFPFQQLQELWLCVAGTNISEELGKLYPVTEGMRLDVQRRDGIVASLCSGGGTLMPKVVFTSRDSDYQQLPGFLAPFAFITWLCIHEHLLNNSDFGSPPPLHALKVLCVRLAAPCEYAGRWPHMRHPARESGGFLVGDLGEPPWDLPALREVRIGAPIAADAPLSIALHDVARWILHGLAFYGTAKLDAVVLSGVSVADSDFRAGWSALSEETRSIRIEEESDATYFPAADTMLYQARLAALFPA